MYRSRLAIVAAIFLAVIFAGCGGEEATKVEMKPADTSQFERMKEQMTKNIKADKTGKPITTK